MRGAPASDADAHFEGLSDPRAHDAEPLREVAPARREHLFGGSLANVRARMGDPLALA